MRWQATCPDAAGMPSGIGANVSHVEYMSDSGMRTHVVCFNESFA